MELVQLTILPIEMLCKIMCYVPLQDQRTLRFVCKLFKKLIDIDMKFMENYTFKITKRNIKSVREHLEKGNYTEFPLKEMHLIKLEDKQQEEEDLQKILEKIGEKIEKLIIEKTKIFVGLQKNFKNLKSLQICPSHIADIGFENLNLSKFPYLEHFEIINSDIDSNTNNRFLHELAEKPAQTLKTLKLDRETANQALIELLSRQLLIENLKIRLPVAYEKCASKWKVILGNMLNLKVLGLFCNRENFTKFMIENLSEKTKLENIELHYAREHVIKAFIDKWQNSLKSITLKSSSIDKIELSKLRNLRYLSLKFCSNLTSTGLLNAIGTAGNFILLEELHWHSKGKIIQSEMISIFSQLPNLLVLTFQNCCPHTVTNDILACIFQHQRHLRILEINHSKIITDDGFVGFGHNPCGIERLHELEELTLRCTGLTDRTLKALKIPKLRSLKLNTCHDITTEGIEQLVINCPLLETLGLPAAIFVDPNAVKIIENSLKYLRNLYVSYYDTRGKQKLQIYCNGIKGA